MSGQGVIAICVSVEPFGTTHHKSLYHLSKSEDVALRSEARYLTNESGERIGVVLDVAEYERLRRSAEETARAERHPSIAFRGTEGSRRAWVPGTPLDVWEIVVGHEEMGRQRLLDETRISEDYLAVALAYHRAYQDEMDQKFQENARPLQYWRELYPNLNIQTTDNRPEALSHRASGANHRGSPNHPSSGSLGASSIPRES